jgi:hypothetical protein
MIREKTQWLAIIAKSILEYASRYLNGIYKLYLNINRKNCLMYKLILNCYLLLNCVNNVITDISKNYI